MTRRYAVAFGANLGRPAETYDWVIHQLQEHPTTVSVIASELYSSLPVGGPENQPIFQNGCLLVETSASLLELWDELVQLERTAGRTRQIRWDARPLDLDIVLSHGPTETELELIIPHPRMHYRRFVLAPLADIAAEWYHPILRATVDDLNSRLAKNNITIGVIGAAESEIQSFQDVLVSLAVDAKVLAFAELWAEPIVHSGHLIGLAIPTTIFVAPVHHSSLDLLAVVEDRFIRTPTVHSRDEDLAFCPVFDARRSRSGDLTARLEVLAGSMAQVRLAKNVYPT